MHQITSATTPLINCKGMASFQNDDISDDQAFVKAYLTLNVSFPHPVSQNQYKYQNTLIIELS